MRLRSLRPSSHSGVGRRARVGRLNPAPPVVVCFVVAAAAAAAAGVAAVGGGVAASARAVSHPAEVRQVRDGGTPPTSGTASISGVVVDDAEPARPVRRAVVTLTGDGLRPARGAITDDDGRFALGGLPPGRFTLTAERGGYVSSMYGAKRPGRAGTPITVASGQQISDLRVRLWRGAVLAGVIFDASGAPLPHTAVAAVPAREVTPAAMTLSNNSHARTNDLGEYRIFGLEPGTYVVRAGNVEFNQVQLAASEAGIDAVFAALAARADRPVALPAPSGGATTTMSAPATAVSAAPIYYPGTPAVADATAITVTAGEVRGGLDFVVQHVPIAVVRGTVAGPDGVPVPRAFVRLAVGTAPERFASAAPQPVTASSEPDGSFELGPVSPGDYQLLVRGAAGSPAGPGGEPAAGPMGWASLPISVTGADIDLGSVPLQPGMTFSGRVGFDADAASPPPSDLTGIRVHLQAESLVEAPAQGRGRPMTSNARFLQPAAVRADGTFEVTGLVPDEYRVSATGGAVGGDGWWLRAAMWNGRDLLDAPLRLAPGTNVDDVTLVFTDRRTELSGTIATVDGAPVSDLFVLAYPAEAALRVPHSRRVMAVRPDSSGRFVLSNLPPGAYLLCALTDVDEGEWNEPGFLDRLVAASIPVALGEGETKVQDLQVGGGLRQ